MSNFIKKIIKFFSCSANNACNENMAENKYENSEGEKLLAEGFLQAAVRLKNTMKINSEADKKALIFTAKIGKLITRIPMDEAVDAFESMMENNITNKFYIK